MCEGKGAWVCGSVKEWVCVCGWVGWWWERGERSVGHGWVDGQAGGCVGGGCGQLVGGRWVGGWVGASGCVDGWLGGWGGGCRVHKVYGLMQLQQCQENGTQPNFSKLVVVCTSRCLLVSVACSKSWVGG